MFPFLSFLSVHVLKEGTGFQYVAISHLPIALLEAFKLGPTLFWRSEEATLTQPLGHSSIHLTVSRTSLQRLIKARLLENGEESLCFLIAPVHACNLLIF
uniref:Uncharacterized protein n=1 Tax=Ailuropoda melanoleuca TaxID=9646 RepID=A0A7N5JK22_AILME